MGKYESPVVEVFAFSQMDIVTASSIELDGAVFFDEDNDLGWSIYFPQA